LGHSIGKNVLPHRSQRYRTALYSTIHRFTPLDEKRKSMIRRNTPRIARIFLLLQYLHRLHTILSRLLTRNLRSPFFFARSIRAIRLLVRKNTRSRW